jgi:hypothetical protein
MLSTDAELIRDRLTALGWTVKHLAAPALIVEGRDMDVVSVLIERGMFRGHVVALLASEDGDVADRFAPLARPSIATASRRLSDRNWTIRTQVYDHDCARGELECFRAAVVRPEGISFSSSLSLFEKRGWRIDRDRSGETFFDEPHWSIEGVRAGDLLTLGAVWSGGGVDTAAIDIDGGVSVTVRTRRFFASATVASRTHAEALVTAF